MRDDFATTRHTKFKKLCSDEQLETMGGESRKRMGNVQPEQTVGMYSQSRRWGYDAKE